MNKNLVFSILILAAFFPATTSIASASSSETFDEILQPYEAIRLTLLEDSIEGIGEPATGIREIAEAAAKDAKTDDEIRPLLTRIVDSAGDLAEAEGIEAVRTAFYEMSKILVQYRSKVQGDNLPRVIYCPMAKKSWLQLEDEVGNPYHGQSMLRCGNDVSN